MRLLHLLVNGACETELDARRCCKCEAESHPATLTNRASSSGTGWFFRDWFLKQVMQDHATQFRISRDGSWRKLRNA